LTLPAIKDQGDTALVPIVSSARALELICKKWERYTCRPDAVVLEGPLAGGHLGFKIDQLHLESNRLETLLPRKRGGDEARGFLLSLQEAFIPMRIL